MTVTLTDAQARRTHGLAASHIRALHNWIATAVEQGRHDDAEDLVRDLRQYQALFATTNVDALRVINWSKRA